MTEKIDVAERLREHFVASVDWYLEREMSGGEELSDQENKTVHLFLGPLSQSIDAISASEMQLATELAASRPGKFQDALETLIRCVGRTFHPTNAEEFVRTLNRFVLIKAA